MIRRAVSLGLCVVAACAPKPEPAPPPLAQTSAPTPPTKRFVAPATRKGPDRDVLHGVDIPDPYRWLEETSDESAAWLATQAGLTENLLAKLPERAWFRERVRALSDFDRRGLPQKRKRHYYFVQSSALGAPRILRTLGSLTAKPEVVVDAPRLPAGAQLGDFGLSDDGKLLAYELILAGSDARVWKVRDTQTLRDHSDEVRMLRGSRPAWLPDQRSFVYSSYPEPSSPIAPNRNARVFVHRLATPQAKDRVLYERPDDPDLRLVPRVAPPYLLIGASRSAGPENRVLVFDLRAVGAGLRDPKFVLGADLANDFALVGIHAGRLLFRTTSGAPRGRVIAVDPKRPAPQHWSTVIPEGEALIQNVQRMDDRLLVTRLERMRVQVDVHDLDGKLRATALPARSGTVLGASSQTGDPEVLIHFSSHSTPPLLLRYDLLTRQLSVASRPRLSFDPRRIETRETSFAARDGTRVPVVLTSRRGATPNPERATMLTAYGGFGRSTTPAWSPGVAAWVEAGGLHAIATVRGGGELGLRWYRAGSGDAKQTTFDDFVDAAEWLARQGLTSPSRLATMGSSNGGLVVGAALVQRPDAFAAVLPDVGLFDMLRFARFTAGPRWVSDYGDPERLEGFSTLLSYSPLHNVRPDTTFPAVLLTTGDSDDRVLPWHSYKMVAALQEAQAGEAPILLRVDPAAGHGAGKPPAQRIAETADRWAFAAHFTRLGLPARSAIGDTGGDAGADAELPPTEFDLDAGPNATDAGAPTVDAAPAAVTADPAR